MLTIGISGKMGSGKTTLANDIIKHFFEMPFRYLNFADALREKIWQDFSLERLGFMPHDLVKPNVKEINLSHDKTVRQALQMIGQAYRDIDEDYWVSQYQNMFILGWEEGLVTVTSDVRYLNEVKCIEEMDGIVLRLTRQVNNDQHESETALDNWAWKPEQFIDNQDMTEDQTFKAALTIIEPYLKGNTCLKARLNEKS